MSGIENYEVCFYTVDAVQFPDKPESVSVIASINVVATSSSDSFVRAEEQIILPKGFVGKASTVNIRGLKFTVEIEKVE